MFDYLPLDSPRKRVSPTQLLYIRLRVFDRYLCKSVDRCVDVVDIYKVYKLYSVKIENITAESQSEQEALQRMHSTTVYG